MNSLTAACAILAAAVVAAESAPAEKILLGREYNANKSLVRVPVMCSEEEKSCLSLNLLFHPPSNQCLPVGYLRGKCRYAADKCEFNTERGRLVATCHFTAQCASGLPPLERSGKCPARGAVCECSGASPDALGLFGGAECACARSRAGEGERVLQPTEAGRCVVPDFAWRPHHAPGGGLPAKKRKCPQEQKACDAASGKVWFRGACHQLLQRGPCKANFIVVLARGRRKFASCQREDNGCQTGRIRLAVDRLCHDAHLFSGPDIRTHRDAFGLYRLSFGNDRHTANLFQCVNYIQGAGGNNKPKNKRVKGRKKIPRDKNVRRKGKRKDIN